MCITRTVHQDHKTLHQNEAGPGTVRNKSMSNTKIKLVPPLESMRGSGSDRSLNYDLEYF